MVSQKVCQFERVCRLQLQLNHPERFDNIFSWNGGIPYGKEIPECCGKYLEESGISSILVANESFGPEVVKSFMEGSHFV